MKKSRHHNSGHYGLHGTSHLSIEEIDRILEQHRRSTALQTQEGAAAIDIERPSQSPAALRAVFPGSHRGLDLSQFFSLIDCDCEQTVRHRSDEALAILNDVLLNEKVSGATAYKAAEFCRRLCRYTSDPKFFEVAHQLYERAHSDGWGRRPHRENHASLLITAGRLEEALRLLKTLHPFPEDTRDAAGFILWGTYFTQAASKGHGYSSPGDTCGLAVACLNKAMSASLGNNSQAHYVQKHLDAVRSQGHRVTPYSWDEAAPLIDKIAAGAVTPVIPVPVTEPASLAGP